MGVESAALKVESRVLGPALEAAKERGEEGGHNTKDADDEGVNESGKQCTCEDEGEAEDVDVAAGYVSAEGLPRQGKGTLRETTWRRPLH